MRIRRPCRLCHGFHGVKVIHTRVVFALNNSSAGRRCGTKSGSRAAFANGAFSGSMDGDPPERANGRGLKSWPVNKPRRSHFPCFQCFRDSLPPSLQCIHDAAFCAAVHTTYDWNNGCASPRMQVCACTNTASTHAEVVLSQLANKTARNRAKLFRADLIVPPSRGGESTLYSA